MTLRISEIFGPTVQGEGLLIGEPTVFVRAGGCDYRCQWCDTLHAVDKAYRQTWEAMSAEAVWAKVQELSGGQPLTVSLSGGNPALQDFGPLIALGKAQGYRFACETQGSIAKPWFSELDTLVLSPKPPSSGHDVDWERFAVCLAMAQDVRQVILKYVIFNDADYDWARAAAARFPHLPVCVQPGNPEVDPDTAVDLDALSSRLRRLVEKTVADGWFTARVLPQLHVLIWGNQRGV